ncbi:hypothetical protein AMATHDRAFT_11380 [Amanita thiersii Skay4041]|uniref:Uncharacterized protein n=1 Tax=Amanita thiersii Skay4041 TaxID=703135 RepID=A0A2A9N923_9AGAR|nr:hypothetical protein AMATHDRAFT_11380 [Amanita thiersii Skay4041]
MLTTGETLSIESVKMSIRKGINKDKQEDVETLKIGCSGSKPKTKYRTLDGSGNGKITTT